MSGMLSFRSAVAESDYSDQNWDTTRTKVAIPNIKPPSAQPDQLRRDEFVRLAAQWTEDTTFMSDISEMIAHPAYQAIVAMGAPAIGLILSEMEKSPDFWFEALRTLTGSNPVPPEDAGDMDRMTRLWLDWGSKYNYR